MNRPAAQSLRRIFLEGVSLLLLAAVPAALTAWLHPRHPVWSWTAPGVAEIDLDDALHATPPVLWVDARQPSDYRAQHIPGAILLNEDAWEDLLPGLIAAERPGRMIVVYCDSAQCGASREVARRLQRELNRSDIFVLKGGWATWRQFQP